MDTETEKRFIEIETKLAYMEDFTAQVQGVVVGQAKEIENLKREINMMSEKIRDLIENAEGDIPNRKPPHY